MYYLSSWEQHDHIERKSCDRFASRLGRRLAGSLARGAGFGIVGEIIIGVTGALSGAYLLPQLDISIGNGLVGAIVSATISAVLLLLIPWAACGGRRW